MTGRPLEYKKGIYHMAYDNNKNLLFVCGFEGSIFVYDPYIDFYVYRLDTNSEVSISNLICNEKENELISIDIKGNIKIWDTMFFVNTQTISVYNKNNTEEEKNRILDEFKMVYLKKQKKILVYGKEVFVYELYYKKNRQKSKPGAS